MSFENRVCLITGAASGIGREVVTLLANRGAKIVGGDMSDLSADEFEEKIGGHESARFVQTDVADLDSVKRLVATTIDEFARIDVLVNCAGISSLSRVDDITPDEWDSVLGVNLKGVFLVCQQTLRKMVERGHGTIVNISSASAKIGGVAVGAHYAASKAGVITLTKSLALYGAPHGITVNCVCPGPTQTPLTDAWGEELNREFAAKIPLKRYATALEVAETVAFLASDAARYITGETVDVNGGLVMD